MFGLIQSRAWLTGISVLLVGLPDSWQFTRYSLREFRLVYQVMFVLAATHRRARLVAVERGCDGLGLVDAVLVVTMDDLISRLARYTGLAAQSVRAVLADLTYGSRQQHPDPALQPLIQLSKSHYAVSPFFLSGVNYFYPSATTISPHQRQLQS